ncbi:hypothetical protein [Nocardia sp. NPDC051981]|uniref:DUF7691 family protein n=1 Tax=Nocardia sp. NPDC051981 TaxID=3155417 RepID=UPI003414C571
MIGSGDRELLEHLLNRLGAELDDLDDQAESWGASVPARQALTTMILDAEYWKDVPDRSSDAAIYIYVFEAMCQHYGASLESGEYTMSNEWFGEVEEAFADVGVCCEPSEYFLGGNLPLPRAFPYPTAGWVSLDSMDLLRNEMEKALSADADPDALDTAAELSQWAQDCLSTQRDLVWFFY